MKGRDIEKQSTVPSATIRSISSGERRPPTSMRGTSTAFLISLA